MGETHLEGAVVSWLGACAGASLVASEPSPRVVIAGMALAGIGGLAVDTDHRRSEAAQFLRMAGVAVLTIAGLGLVSQAVTHAPNYWPLLAAGGLLLAWLPALTRPHDGGYRGVLHSVWGLLAAGALSFAPLLFVGGWPVWASAALMCGWCSHLVLDAMTKEGLPLAWAPGNPGPRFGWLPARYSMTTGGKRPRKGQGRRKGHSRAGMEYRLVQPVLAVAGIFAVWVLVIGGGG